MARLGSATTGSLCSDLDAESFTSGVLGLMVPSSGDLGLLVSSGGIVGIKPFAAPAHGLPSNGHEIVSILRSIFVMPLVRLVCSIFSRLCL